MGFGSFEEIRAWQLARAFKKGIYELIERTSIATDFELRNQLREAAAGAPAHIAEGFGRFDPLDFARFVKMGKASVIECRNHLIDAVDRRHIAEDERLKHDARAEEALTEIVGLIEYLQSPEAKRNAERIRQKREAHRQAHEPRTPEPRTRTRTRNLEPGTWNGKRRYRVTAMLGARLSDC